jgi:hypothetical protein
MKLSNETLTVLKNFSSINDGLEFKTGKTLRTISTGKSVLAQAVLNDTFPSDFCVHELNNFLAVHSLYKDPEIDFEGSNIIFKSGRNKIRYRMSDRESIVIPPAKNIPLNDVDCSFTLSKSDYDNILKSAGVLSSPHIAIQSDGEKIEIITFDAVDDSANINSTYITEGNGKSFKIVFRTENIKLISGDYDIKVSFKGFVHFNNTKEDIEYWIAFEAAHSSTGE